MSKLEVANEEIRYKCPKDKCEGILHKNKSKYSLGGYKCDGDTGHYINEKWLEAEIKKMNEEEKGMHEEKAIHVVKKNDGQCVFS